MYDLGYLFCLYGYFVRFVSGSGWQCCVLMVVGIGVCGDGVFGECYGYDGVGCGVVLDGDWLVLLQYSVVLEEWMQ